MLLQSVLEIPILKCTSELRTGHQRLYHVRVCAAPGEAFNILWYVLGIAYAALLMNVSMSAGSSVGHVYFRGVHHHLMDALIYGNRFENS